MKNLTRTETADFLAAHDHYLILTHTRPDGDTIGSAAALCLGLRSLGKTAHIGRENNGADGMKPSAPRSLFGDAPFAYLPMPLRTGGRRAS